MFKYEPGKYPEFDELFSDEAADEVEELIRFLENDNSNIYSILMPENSKIKDKAVYAALMIIFRNLVSSDIRNNKLIWKLYFQGTQVSAMKDDNIFRILLSDTTAKLHLTKDFLLLITEYMDSWEDVSIRRKDDSSDDYVLCFIYRDSRAQALREVKADMRVRFFVALLIAAGLILLGLLIIFIMKFSVFSTSTRIG